MSGLNPSDPSTIVPSDKFTTKHTFEGITSQDSQRYFYRVHAGTAGFHGALHPAYGFLASKRPLPLRFTGSGEQLRDLAAKHINQYKYPGRDRSASPFVSGSYSLAYTLFESRRRAAYHGTINPYLPYISIIDSKKLGPDVWLGTEIVGAWYEDESFFARWAEEVLVYRQIPASAIVCTLSLDILCSLLPPWCDGLKDNIKLTSLWSTEAVGDALRNLSSNNNTPGDEEALLEKAVKESMALLRLLPNSLAESDANTPHIVDFVARFAAIFCWWPKWTADTDPNEYPAMLERIRCMVSQRSLKPRIKSEVEKIFESFRADIPRMLANVERAQKTTPQRNRKPYERNSVKKEEDD
ncbi:hypothetical protein R3P38DRAFT_1866700 [Favolaschia claudopus]|uniref:SRP54-type proteins GTP-binding domain-containing protein n=1 Tax=Favolaschia claudopus TaxID=2862362 RepID=A0AAW0DA58_9AGAR